jgi:hypothetical protein
MLPMDKVRIEGLRMNDIGLGKSTFSKKKLDEFAAFQDSQGTRRVYLAETAELAYIVRNERRMGIGPGCPGSDITDRPHWDELHPLVLHDLTLPVFCITSVDGMGRVDTRGDNLPESGHYFKV